jgi:hypothetical protein
MTHSMQIMMRKIDREGGFPQGEIELSDGKDLETPAARMGEGEDEPRAKEGNETEAKYGERTRPPYRWGAGVVRGGL